MSSLSISKPAESSSKLSDIEQDVSTIASTSSDSGFIGCTMYSTTTWFGTITSSTFVTTPMSCAQVVEKNKEKTIYKFNNKGNLIESNRYDSKGNFSWKYNYKYDNRGNKIYECSSNSIGENYIDYPYKFTYEFDDIGNWIKKIEYRNNIPSIIYERDIEYY